MNKTMFQSSYLSFVSNEVNFWFAWLSWCSSWNCNFWGFFRFLDQNIDQSFFFILGLYWNYWSSWGWWTWGFDEDNFIMFLGLCNWNWALWSEFFRFWWWNMDINVLLYCCATSETTSKTTSESTATSESSSHTTSKSSSCTTSET